MNDPRPASAVSPEVRNLAKLAIAGALFFPLMLVVIAAIQWDFLHDRGWRVLDHGDVTWPSGTALGPSGYLQVLNFVVFGVAILALALALRRSLNVSRNVTSWLVGLLGVAVLASAIRIDEPSAFGSGGSPDTWSGVVHGIAFGLLLISLLAATITAGVQLRRDPRWADLARVSAGAAVALLVAFFGVSAVNGAIGFYLFIAILVAWLVALALRAHRLAG